MENVTKAQELFTDLGGKSLEAAALWAQASRTALDAMVEFSAASAREGVRLGAELQRTALDAMRDGQATLATWQGGWKQAPTDPVAGYQKAVADGVTQAQKAVHLVETATQAVVRTTEVLQATTESAGKGIQKALADAVAGTREIYARN